MPTPQECNQLLEEFSTLETLKAAFDIAYEDAVRTGNLEQVRELKRELSDRLEALKEKVNPLERILLIKEQYQRQRDIHERRILTQQPSGEYTAQFIDGKEYPFPSYEEVVQRLRDNKEMLKLKAEQGFSQMLIVPFGMSLNVLIEKYKATLVKHFEEKKLFFTKENQDDDTEALVSITEAKFDSNEPVWTWDGYNQADVENKLVYFPKEFTQNHQGKTKQEILDQSQSGWQIVFVENMPNIPAEGQAQTKGGRMQIDNKGSSIKAFIKQGETIPSPEEYLKALLEDPQYQHEDGGTMEDELIYMITYLEDYNQIINDYSGNGKIAYKVGAYFHASDDVPYACWYRGNRQTSVSRDDGGSRDGDCGVRPSVRV